MVSLKTSALLLLFTIITTVTSQDPENHNESSAQFLKKVIGQLKMDNIGYRNVGDMDRSEITGPTPLPPYNNNYHVQGQHLPFQVIGHNPTGHEEVQDISGQSHPIAELSDFHGTTGEGVPAPPLSNAEIATLYEEALKKGATLDLKNGGPLQGGLPDEFKQQLGLDDQNAQGYYYYFYPLKDGGKDGEKTKEDEALMAMASSNENRVEPLFVAMSGFIGMALVFVVSVLFLPKFGNIQANRDKVPGPALKRSPSELTSLTRLVVQSINGKDCSARIACEVGRAMHKIQIDNKPLRVLEIMLPPAIAKQLQRFRQSSSPKNRCHMPCRLNPTINVKPKPKPKPNVKQQNNKNKNKKN